MRANTLVNRLLEADDLDDLDNPEPYVSWLGQKEDLGPLDGIRFGAHIRVIERDRDEEPNAEINADDPQIADQLERDYSLLEAAGLGLLRMVGLHVSDEGHDEDSRVASVWILTDEPATRRSIPVERQIALAKMIVEAEGRWPATPAGTQPFFLGLDHTFVYAHVSEAGKQLLDLDIEFTGIDALAEWLKVNLTEAIDDPDDPEAFIKNYEIPEPYGLNRVVQAYAGCALWSSMDDDDTPLDNNYGVSDISPETMEKMRADCSLFMSENAADLEDWDSDQVGHDLWLTRNHHGAGFWDRGIGTEEQRERLTAAAHAMGEVNLFALEDGQVIGEAIEADPDDIDPMAYAVNTLDVNTLLPRLGYWKEGGGWSKNILREPRRRDLMIEVTRRGLGMDPEYASIPYDVIVYAANAGGKTWHPFLYRYGRTTNQLEPLLKRLELGIRLNGLADEPMQEAQEDLDDPDSFIRNMETNWKDKLLALGFAPDKARPTDYTLAFKTNDRIYHVFIAINQRALTVERELLGGGPHRRFFLHQPERYLMQFPSNDALVAFAEVICKRLNDWRSGGGALRDVLISVALAHMFEKHQGRKAKRVGETLDSAPAIPISEPDPDDPADNIERYTASLDPGKMLKTMGFHEQRPTWKCADPDYKWWQYFDHNGLKWTVIGKTEEPHNFEVSVYRATSSLKGMPNYQEIGGFSCPVEELGLMLRTALSRPPA